jgi:signal transduction histidine kinase
MPPAKKGQTSGGGAAARQASPAVAVADALPWQDLLEVLPVPLWIIGPQADLWFGNRAWHAMTANASHTVAPTSIDWLQVLHEDDRHRAVTAFHSAAAVRRGVQINLRLRANDGFRSWSFVGQPFCTPTGEVEMFIGAAHDTTAAEDAHRRLRELSVRLVAAQESERARIARELHDDIAQRIVLLTVKLGSAAKTRPFSTTLARRTLDDARDMLQDLTKGIHLLSRELHPPKLTMRGLAPTLRALCDEMAANSGVAVQFAEDTEPVEVSEDTALCVFRVMQEALQNSVKHSGGRKVDVRLRQDASSVTLWVADDGAGFDPASAHSTGLGLMTMRERVELSGGRLRIISEPACGTMVEAIVPARSSLPAS